MRRLFLIATISVLAVAKPELYKEKEDFHYSRSSSDDGSKSGFYGAQRGNMGGNYERAHNMDPLAQHQMSGLVRQVEGELGDASKTRTGSVFTAANSRGVYGSGSYDLNNLDDRNFQEGVSYDNSHSQSQSSLSNANHDQYLSSASHNSRHSSSRLQDSRHNGYRQNLDHSGQMLQTADLQTADNRNSAGEYQYGGQRTSSGYYSESGYHGHNAYDQSSSNLRSSSDYGANTQSRLVSATPVRVVIRPGTRVALPVAAQTYDASRSASSTFDQNAINSESEILSNGAQQSNFRPSGEAKHYESSYKYSKEWEKHDRQPVPLAIPTVNPIPKNSELYDDRQMAYTSSDGHYRASGIDSDSQLSNIYNNGYSSNVKSSSSSQSRQHSNYNAQHQTSLSDSGSNAYTHGAYNSGLNADLTNLVKDQDSRPKSYQSSYSYHKAWERQGDPYVIKPGSNDYDGQTSQKLTAASINQGTHLSHQYGTNHKQSHQSYSHGSVLDCDCDENGHIRVVRSSNTDQIPEYAQYQQSQTSYDGQEELGQQSQNGWENLEDLGQQTQSKWDNLEYLGQQSESKWKNLQESHQETQSKWDQLEVTEQETQGKLDNLEDLGQQTQQEWGKNEKFQPEQLEELSQQTQKEVDSTQQQQNQSDKFEGQTQQNDNTFYNFTHQQNEQSLLGQQTQKEVDSTQQQKNQLDKFEGQTQQNNQQNGNAFNTFTQQQNEQSSDQLNSFIYHSQISQMEKNDKSDHPIQNTWDKINNFGIYNPQSNSNKDANNLEQKFQVNSSNLENVDKIQSSHKEQSITYTPREVQNTWDKLDSFDARQNVQSGNQNTQNFNLQNQRDSNTTQKINSNISTVIKENNNKSNTNKINNIWDKIDRFGYSQNGQTNNNQNQFSQSNVEISNQNKHSDKGITPVDVMKSVYEQSQDDTQQTSQKSDSDFQVNSGTFVTNVRYVSPGTYVFSYGQGKDTNSNQQSQTIYGNSQDISTYVNQVEQLMNEYNHLYSTHSSQNASSIQGLWDKINKLDKNFTTSSTNNVQSVNENIFTNGYTQSQQNWMQEHSYHSSSDSDQTPYQNNQFRWHYVANQPWQFTTNNENTNSNQFESHYAGSRPWGLTTNNENINSNQFESHYGGYQPEQFTINNENTNSNHFGSHYGGHHSLQSTVNNENMNPNHFGSHYGGYRPWHSTVNNENSVSDTSASHYGGYRPEQSTVPSENVNTNEKPKDEQVSQFELQPVDIGRGDIGAEDSSSDVTVTVEKSSNSNDKTYKTSEEIESLSLTKESNRTVNNQLNQQVYSNANQNTQAQSDSTLNVLSITQQKWLEEQRRHAQQNNRGVTSRSTTSISSTTAKSTYQQTNLANNYNSEVHNKQENEQSQTINSESQSDYYNNNKPYKFDQHPIRPVSNNDRDIIQNTPSKPNEMKFDEHPIRPVSNNDRDIIQNTPSKPNEMKFDEHPIRPVSNNDRDIIQNTPSKPNEKVDNGQNLDQAPEEIEQQNMEQKFVDLEQQSENLDQQSQTSWSQNLEDLGQQVHTANDDLQQQTDTQQIQDFGTSFKENQKQDFYEQKYQSAKYGEVQSSQKDVQSESQKKTDMVITPEEPTTAKPGFWKSVGSKFTNAKDKVASWFNSS